MNEEYIFPLVNISKLQSEALAGRLEVTAVL
jgi:hypothetical protein